MTPAAPRTAAPEARMRRVDMARRFYRFDCDMARLWHQTCGCPGTWPCRECQGYQRRVDASSLKYDLVRAALYDTPAHLPRQLAIWAERERRALVGSVAW